MANSTKGVAGVNYGQPGQLIYRPREDVGGGVGSIHCTRLSSQPPSFSVVGTTAELYPPTKISSSASSLKPAHQRQVHKQWLRDNHPEALPGLGSIDELLAEELTSAASQASAASTRQLLAIGQITDVTSSTQRTSTCAIALAAGEAGEKLRIARVNQSQWAWKDPEPNAPEATGSEADGHDGARLELAVIDPDSWQDECMWTNDGLPFTQIKFATHIAANESIRWLLAQKATSTSILNPEYHKVPTGDINIETIDFHKPSKIDPQHELTITHLQTGGRAHSDVAFNAPSLGSAAQIAIMDEAGYWTVWAIVGRTRVDNRQVKRAILRQQGHVQDGLLSDVVFNSHYSSRPHGGLFVGMAEGNDFQTSFDPTSTFSRAPYLMVWSPEKFEVVALEDGTLLQPLQIPTRGAARPNNILDAQVSPVTQTQVFILTTQSLLWMDVPRHGMSSKPAIILECPHLPAMKDLRMSLCRASDDDDTVLVFLYTSEGSHFAINWFRLSEDSELPIWHRQILPIGDLAPSGLKPSKLNLLLFQHSRILAAEEESSSDLGEQYRRRGVSFFQGFLLSEELGLRYCVSTTKLHPGLAVVLPGQRLNADQRHKSQSWRKQHRLISKHILNAFVLPDGLDADDLDLRSRQEKEPSSQVDRHREEGSHVIRGRKVLSIRRIVAAMEDRLEVEDREGSPVLPASAIEILDSVLESGIAEASVPLFTWRDVFEIYDNGSGWVPAINVEANLRQLKQRLEDEVTMPTLRLSGPEEAGNASTKADAIQDELNSLRGRRQNDKQPRLSLAKLVSDYYLSGHGFLIQDVPLFGPGQDYGSSTQETQERAVPSQASRSSQSPGRIRSSSPASAVPAEKLQGQFRRLQLLAPSLRPGPLAAKKPPKVLSLWPSERGTDIAGYISSVAAESDMKFDDVRQRAQRAEARKKAQADKLKRPAFTRRGFADEEGLGKAPRAQPQVEPFRSSPQPMVPMSSQRIPMSSQSQGGFGSMVTMSQPIPGAFGDRKKAKKTAKKKSGFR